MGTSYLSLSFVVYQTKTTEKIDFEFERKNALFKNVNGWLHKNTKGWLHTLAEFTIEI